MVSVSSSAASVLACSQVLTVCPSTVYGRALRTRDGRVRGRCDVHTNTIEGAFGLFKRGLVGSFHQISRKHLDRYLDEFEFRYNNRRNPYLFRDTLTRLVQAESMPYEQLTHSA